MRRIAFRFACVVLALSASFALAQEPGDEGYQDYSGQSVSEVRIEGLERVDEQRIRSQLEVQAGAAYNERAIARDIRRLFDMGYFSDIRADARPSGAGVAVVYVVEEKQVIEEIRILGNDQLRERNVRGVLSWREGDSFIPEAYDDEREAILQLYQSKGFPNASVDILVEEVGQSRVRITFIIAERGKARIKSVRFEGNETLSRRDLKKVMETKRSWWFLGGKYDETTFEADLERILAEYGDYGRLEAEVVGTDFEYTEDGKGVHITIHLAEGPEYRVRQMEASGNEVFDDDEVMRLLDVQAGDVHDRGQVQEDADLIQRGYEDSGYVNARVAPQVTLDRDAKTTHVVHRVNEGDLKYIREIKITGNSVTRDDVIRREILSFPGERFDGGLLRMSQRKLEGLDYFDAIRVTMEDLGSDTSYSNLLVDVEEGKTGFFNFGAGYSTEDKFGGYGELRFNNFDIMNWPSFSGGGQQFRLRLHLGDRRDQYYLSFTDPEIFGYPLAFGFDVFDESYEYRGGTRYTEERTGAQLRFGKQLSPFVGVRTMLRYADTDITGLPWFAWFTYPPEYWRQAEGSTTISNLWGISRNTLDSPRDPGSGSRHDLEIEVAGLGGDNEFWKLQHDSIWYWSLDRDRKWILSYQTREGIGDDYGSSDYIPIQDRYYAGGTTTVRGYENRDIGPKSAGFFGWGEKVAVGGDMRVLQNLEIKYKVTEQFRLYGFVDGGGVWAEMSDFDLGDMKFGAGLGFGVDIPRMGPIRLDYGIPINPEDDQGSGRLHLQTGFRF